VRRVGRPGAPGSRTYAPTAGTATAGTTAPSTTATATGPAKADN
jgi:hypothetical protein